MNVHTLIFAAIVGAVAVLWWAADGTRWSPARAVMWLLAGWRWRHTAHVAWVAGADLLTMLAKPADANTWPEPGTQDRCTCGARRCDNKARGVYCPPQRAPGLTQTLLGVGVHQPSTALARWVPGNWSPYPLLLRARLWPAATSARLGRQVQLGGRRVMLP